MREVAPKSQQLPCFCTESSAAIVPIPTSTLTCELVPWSGRQRNFLGLLEPWADARSVTKFGLPVRGQHPLLAGSADASLPSRGLRAAARHWTDLATAVDVEKRPGTLRPGQSPEDGELERRCAVLRGRWRSAHSGVESGADRELALARATGAAPMPADGAAGSNSHVNREGSHCRPATSHSLATCGGKEDNGKAAKAAVAAVFSGLAGDYKALLKPGAGEPRALISKAIPEAITKLWALQRPGTTHEEAVMAIQKWVKRELLLSRADLALRHPPAAKYQTSKGHANGDGSYASEHSPPVKEYTAQILLRLELAQPQDPAPKPVRKVCVALAPVLPGGGVAACHCRELAWLDAC